MSQPTLGRHIKQLEHDLRASLFLRHARGLSLSDAGAALLPHATAMRDAMKALQLTAAGQSHDDGGTVRLTASIFTAHYVLPSILASIRQNAPEIQIELVPTDATENLLFREADLAIRMYRPTQMDIITRHVTDLSMGPYAARSYLQRKGRPTTLEALRAHDLVGFDRDDLILRVMADMGWAATRDWFAVRCDNQATYWALVRAGCGVGFTQNIVGRADPLVEAIPIDLDLQPLPVWLAAPDAMRQTPRVRRVWDLLVQHLSRLR